MKKIKEAVQVHAGEWIPRIALVAVFGFSGLAVLGAAKVYKKFMNSRDYPLDLSGYEDPYEN